MAQDPNDPGTASMAEFPRTIGYTRAALLGEDLQEQITALKDAGCDSIMTETKSPARARATDSSKLSEAIALVGRGDVLIFWRLDHAGPILSIVRLAVTLHDRQANLVSLADGLDTRVQHGNAFFTACRLLTDAGKRSAGARVRDRGYQPRPGRTRMLGKAEERKLSALLEDPRLTRKMVAERMNVSVATVYRYARGSNS